MHESVADRYSEAAITAAVQTATAVDYFLVSSPGQAGERHVSLELQATSFNYYCRADHFDSVTTFTDVASGRKDDRKENRKKEYRKMVQRVTQEGIGKVVVLFLDRFGRNPREILRRNWEPQERGITVRSINDYLQEELLLLRADRMFAVRYQPWTPHNF